MPVGFDRSLPSLRTAGRTILGNAGEPFRLKEFLLFYREDKDCFTASAFHFDVLELFRDDHKASLRVEFERSNQSGRLIAERQFISASGLWFA